MPVALRARVAAAVRRTSRGRSRTRAHEAPRRARGCRARAASPAASPVSPSSKDAKSGLLQHINDAIHPFTEPAANARFIALALGGMLCSIATLIHDSYLPVFMRDELGLTNTRIGSVQAASQLLCQLSKSFSGVLGDLLGSQVKILMFGTLLTAICKPMFAISSSLFATLGAGACLWCITVGKMADRMSKGFREAPTKALISQTAVRVGEPTDSAFSVRQSLATVGSLVGSAVASVVFILSGRNYSITFAFATIPPILALIWLMYVFGAEARAKVPSEKSTKGSGGAVPAAAAGSGPEAEQGRRTGTETTWIQKLRALHGAFEPAYWQALLVVCVLYFGRFDFAWVTLRAKACLVPKAALPALASATMLGTTITALLVGRGLRGQRAAARNATLLVGFFFLFLANLLLAAPATANMAGMFAACICIGVHMGMTHGLTLSMLSSYMPHTGVTGLGNVSGTAWSFTDVVLGCTLAASNELAGRLTDYTLNASLGNVGCFGGGAAAAIAASLLLFLFSKFGNLGKEGSHSKR